MYLSIYLIQRFCKKDTTTDNVDMSTADDMTYQSKSAVVRCQHTASMTCCRPNNLHTQNWSCLVS